MHKDSELGAHTGRQDLLRKVCLHKGCPRLQKAGQPVRPQKGSLIRCSPTKDTTRNPKNAQSSPVGLERYGLAIHVVYHSADKNSGPGHEAGWSGCCPEQPSARPGEPSEPRPSVRDTVLCCNTGFWGCTHTDIAIAAGVYYIYTDKYVYRIGIQGKTYQLLKVFTRGTYMICS